jgi:hypothetical protein
MMGAWTRTFALRRLSQPLRKPITPSTSSWWVRARQADGRPSASPKPAMRLSDCARASPKSITRSEVVDGDDGRVVHLGDELRLALEALLGFGAELRGRDQLDRDVTVQLRDRPVDDAHPTASELRDDLVPVSQPCAKHCTCSARALSG